MTNPSPSPEHIDRVKRELRAAGMTRYGLIKQEARYLPKLIHNDEPIGGVIYGRYNGSLAMLAATDRRVLFLDRKPGYTNSEEISYDVVAGVTYNKQGSFAAVTLHTRLGSFEMRFVNPRAADHFVHYIEGRVLEHKNGNFRISGNTRPGNSQQQPSEQADSPKQDKDTFEPLLDDKALAFLRKHELGVLSSIDSDGKIHGASVYYVASEQNNVYFLTKSETQKAKDIRNNKPVALTITDPMEYQTLQLEGKAEIETNEDVRQQVFSYIVKPRRTYKGDRLPPVTFIKEGSFVVMRIVLDYVKFRDYSNPS